jgi:hypothetical protein
MVRKLVELSKFLLFNSGTNSFGNNSVFTFYLLLFALYRFLYLLFELLIMGLVKFFMSAFQMELNDYPTLTSPRAGHCVPQASIARDSPECYTTHSSIFATTGTLRSTVADCPRPMA